MDNKQNGSDTAPSVEELQKEIRGLKRKLNLAESNLERARLISVAQARVDAILEDSLRKEIQFFKLVLENTINILLLFDFDGRFAYSSNTFLSVAGIENFGLIHGRHFREVLEPIIPDVCLTKFAGAVDQAVDEKRTVSFEMEIDFNSRGYPRTFSVIVTPMTDEEDEGGKITGIMALFSDITEINKALGVATRANFAKSEFLANMSHEIRTPLNAIMGMSTIAQSSDDVAKIHYCMDKISDSSKHLLGVINDILDMSKIEANHFELCFAEFIFEKMILRIVDMMRFKLEEKKIVFRLTCDPSIPYSINSDEQRLAQVIMNLLSNAIKFTPEKGCISMDVGVDSFSGNDYVLRIKVKDTGIGISKEQQPRLFKAFSQADNSISRRYGGTGLGLVISKNIVTMLGGDIWFESTEGKGTTFTFTVNVPACRLEPTAEAGWDSIRILGHTSPMVQSFARCADRLGLSYRFGKSESEVLELWQKDAFDIILIEWDFADFAYIKRLRTAVGETPIYMIVSDWSDNEKEAKDAGVTDFISAPILLPTIEGLLAKYAPHSEGQKRVVADRYEDKTILLVDDIEINREIIMTMLEPTGVKIVCAENGREALETYTADPERYHLIIMDVQMPEMDGYESTRLIRASGLCRAANIPIIAMTANVFSDDIERCFNCGMNDHIGKPVHMDDVLAKIRKWI